MKVLSKFLVVIFLICDAILAFSILLSNKNIQVLNPKGYIAFQERGLMFLAIGIMLLGVIPVFLFAIFVATRYHEGNKKTKYMPDWGHNNKLQFFYWAGLSAIMGVLSVVCWVSAHQYDPHLALKSNVKPMVIQVVAVRWKWIFIYPDQDIATVNYVQFPQKTPIQFEITAADAPMNSFWIPQLGGQIYAMSGMATQTHLIADGIGTYRGSTAEISGAGFANMTFVAKSTTQEEFDQWVARVRNTPDSLTMVKFNELTLPSENNPIAYYSSTDDNLFTTIVMRYMAPAKNTSDDMNMGSMDSVPAHKMPAM